MRKRYGFDERSIIQPSQMHGGWVSWLNLMWSMWIFLVPLTEAKGAFPHWLWPTLASYAIFLLLFVHVHYGKRRHVISASLAIAALGFALTPLNPGGQGYIIYACAYLAFGLVPRAAIAAMIALVVAYSGYWLLLGLPALYVLNAIVVGLVVGLMNVHYVRRKQADVALKLSHDEVRRLAALAERERIGRDLHDLLGHTLSLVALKSELAGKLVERDPAAAKRELAEVTRVAREALTQVRSAVTGIRAAGLAAELASARLLLEADSIALRYEHAPAVLPPAVETVLAMTVREAVTNIQRHARAQHAEIVLRIDGRWARAGGDATAAGAAAARGKGLAGIADPSETPGAGLRVDSAPGQGTRLEARLPLDTPEAEPDTPDAAAA